jgi:hypothetical protein
MASLTELREALAANLVSIPGVQQSAYLLSAPTPPAIEIQPDAIEYDLTMRRGTDRWRFIVRAFVGATTDIGAQKRLDRMLASAGVDSVKAAIESDRQLGGVCDDLRAVRCSGYRSFQREGAAAVLGAEWEVEVLAEGDT